MVFDTINVNEITLAEPKASRASSSCKTAYIQYRGQKLRIQTALMLTAFDLKVKQMDENSNASANASLSFANESSDPDVKAFKEFLVKVDERIKVLAVEKSAALGKKASKANIDSNFKDSIKTSEKYPSVFSPKVWLNLKNDGGSMKNIDDVSMNLKVFDMDTNPISPDQVKRGCPTALIVTPSYVWCSSIGVGITWSATECIVKPMEDEKACGFTMGAGFDKYKRKQEDVDVDENKKSKYEDEPVYEERDEFEVDGF